MDMHRVEGSREIAAWGWEPLLPKGAKASEFLRRRVPKVGLLAIEFVRDGSVWWYSQVPERVFEDFLVAESKGTFFHAHVRGKYPEQRANDPGA